MSPDDRYFEPDIELMSRADLAALQEESILRLVPYAYENGPLYKKVWSEAGVHPRDIKSMADFYERIPVITKDSVREFRDTYNDPYGGLLCVPPSELTGIMSSSGTTGDATLFADKCDDILPLAASMARDLWEVGLRPGDRTLGNATTFRGGSGQTERMLGAIPVFVNSWFGAWEQVFEAIAEHQIRYVQWLGPVIAEIERLGEKYDLREAFAPLKGASFAGEPLGARAKKMIREDWGVDLFVWTSAGDTGASWECQEHDGYHLWEDHAVVESLDSATRRAVGGGQVGELVVTDIDNLASPLIRYSSEDLVRLDHGVCGCGRTHVRQKPVGRAGDVTLVRGVAVTPTEIWSIVEQEPETSAALFQIIRPTREVDELRIRIGYDTEHTSDLDGLRERLTEKIEKAVGVRPDLEMVTEQEIIARASSAAKIPRVAKA